MKIYKVAIYDQGGRYVKVFDKVVEVRPPASNDGVWTFLLAATTGRPGDRKRVMTTLPVLVEEQEGGE